MHILLVDDDSSSRYLMTTVFEARNHTVQTARDGEEALELANQDLPDAVVTDILMPRMDGYQLCMAWRDNAVLADIPFIFYSGTYVDDADEQFAMTLGADAFLRKPQEFTDVVLAVEELVRTGASRRFKKRPFVAPEEEVLRRYNVRLIEKLERKVAELNLANEELAKTISLLSDEVEAKNELITHLSADVKRLQR